MIFFFSLFLPTLLEIIWLLIFLLLKLFFLFLTIIFTSFVIILSYFFLFFFILFSYEANCINMGMQYFPDHSSVPKHLDRKIRKSFFPPTAEEKEWMHLGIVIICIRFHCGTTLFRTQL